jgi:hypothetical protein
MKPGEAERLRQIWAELGLASNVLSREEGRQRAFEHGKIEIMNLVQLTDLQARE